MSNIQHPQSGPQQPMVYQIRLEGRLDSRWGEWFGDMAIVADDKGDTLLTCTVVDQAALYGLLRKVRDLGLPLLSLSRLEPERKEEPDAGR